MWQITWHNIHVLTVYPQPGLLAAMRHSADSPPPAPFGQRHPAYSVISVHRDSEPWMAEVMLASPNLQVLLENFEVRPDVDVIEQDNPALMDSGYY